MANLRIIRDNAADRATLSASSTAGTLVAANLQNDFKGQVHRSTGTSVTYTATWATAEQIGGVALPAVNLTATATIRVRAYSDTPGGTLVADSTALVACPGPPLGMWDWSLPLNSNAFAWGGAAKTAVWFSSQVMAKAVVIDLVDTGNAAGYIDCARLVIGSYWEPSVQADYGAKASIVDTTTAARNDAGDLLPDAGTLHDTLTLDLKLMPEADRATLMRLARSVGTRGNIFLSLLPGDGLSIVEQDHMIYGKRANGDVTFDFFNAYSHAVSLEGW